MRWFANSTCPVRAHRFSCVLIALAHPHQCRNASFAVQSPARVPRTAMEQTLQAVSLVATMARTVGAATVERLVDQVALAKVARHAQLARVRRAAVTGLTYHDGRAAIAGLTDQAVLAQVATNDDNRAVREAAV